VPTPHREHGLRIVEVEVEHWDAHKSDILSDTFIVSCPISAQGEPL